MLTRCDWLADEAATQAFATRAAACLEAPGIIFLNGSLGAGKSTFVRALGQAFGIRDRIKSPTYTLIEPYWLDNQVCFLHGDLYRLSDPSEIEALGIEEYLSQKTLACIEWPDLFQAYCQITPDWVIDLTIKPNEQGRQITITAHTQNGQAWLKKLG